MTKEKVQDIVVKEYKFVVGEAHPSIETMNLLSQVMEGLHHKLTD